MRLSCTSVMVPGETITEKAKLLKAWGFDGIAVFADYSNWSEEKLDELIHLEKNTGVKPCEFVFMSDDYGHLMSDDLEKREATKKLYKEAARVCAKIGAVSEIEYTYGPQDPLPLFDIYPQMNEQQEEAFLKAYNEIAIEVEGTDGAILIEGINRYESPYMNSIIDCKKVVDKIDIKETGILADFFHMSIEEKDIVQSILQMNGAIKHVHLGDNNRMMPGEGSLDWKSCLKALKETSYEGYLNLECSTSGKPAVTIPEAASFLKNILEEI